MGHDSCVDELFAAFTETLPVSVRGEAERLCRTLGLAPIVVPWSKVFQHEVTLGAPAMVSQAMPALPSTLARDASLAHLLAVIEAFGTDRIQDGQVPETAELTAVLAAARTARDAAFARLNRGQLPPYSEADRETLACISLEREAFVKAEPVTFSRYESISLGKQSLGLPASLALAHAAGWTEKRVRALERALQAIWIGLQLHDDVIDWADDFARGGAWAVLLAAGDSSWADPSRDTTPISTRAFVLRSGILAKMLARSALCFRAARRRTRALGMTRLAGWASEQERRVGELAKREKASAGYANRAHALKSWALVVLA